jgi:hypothetical protein
MPNWVRNYVSVSGSEEDIAKFRETANRPAPNGIMEDGTLTYEENSNRTISFWNFIEPENKETYFSGQNWYDWNCDNWGTKWDACDTEVVEGETKTTLTYTFDTAWSIPEPIFRAMVVKFPTLDFDFESEEEQGWGATYTSSDGDPESRSLILTKEWDIPQSHADYVALEKEDQCVCSWTDDDEDLYSDCPRASQTFDVVVNQVIQVIAKDAESAWETANKLLEDFAKSVSTSGVVVSDEGRTWVEKNNERVYPKLS